MRVWEIRENIGKYDRGDYRSGMRKSSKEMYDCGFEDGYKAAMEDLEMESSHSMGERRYR